MAEMKKVIGVIGAVLAVGLLSASMASAATQTFSSTTPIAIGPALGPALLLAVVAGARRWRRPQQQLGPHGRGLGGDGNDKVGGGASADTVIGGANADRVSGGPGTDNLFGGSPGFPGDGSKDVCAGSTDREHACS